MPGLFRDIRDNDDDDESTSSDSESDELEDNILAHNADVPPPPPAIQLRPDPESGQRSRPVQGPRNVHRGGRNTSMDIFNGFLRNMVPERITGMAIRRNVLFYLVEWRNYGNTSYCIEARLMNVNASTMVIEFHQQLVIESVIDEILESCRNR